MHGLKEEQPIAVDHSKNPKKGWHGCKKSHRFSGLVWIFMSAAMLQSLNHRCWGSPTNTVSEGFSPPASHPTMAWDGRGPPWRTGFPVGTSWPRTPPCLPGHFLLSLPWSFSWRFLGQGQQMPTTVVLVDGCWLWWATLKLWICFWTNHYWPVMNHGC